MKVRNRLASCPCRPLLAPFYLYKLFVFFQTSETRTFVGEQASLNEEKKKRNERAICWDSFCHHDQKKSPKAVRLVLRTIQLRPPLNKSELLRKVHAIFFLRFKIDAKERKIQKQGL